MGSAEILLAEDSQYDARLLLEAFRVAGSDASFRCVADGKAAMDACAPPDGAAFNLIVLDYSLPKHNGGEVVDQFAAWGMLPKVPVVVLSSSLPPEESQRLIDLGVALVAEKPSDLDELCALAGQILSLAKT
jgi:CheY-like chemotaxis protein